MRTVHFVGSIPDPDPVSRVIKEMGPAVRWVPVPESANWIIEELEARGRLPELVTLKRLRYHGHPRYHPGTHSPIYVPRRGRPYPVDKINTGLVGRAADASTRIGTACLVAKLPTQPAVQVGVPAPLDLAWCSSGPLAGRYYQHEVDSLNREVTAIYHRSAGTAVFQLELPLETCAVAMAPAAAQRRVAKKLAASLCQFVAGSPQGSRWILHLCVGDPHGRPVVKGKGVGPLVVLAEALMEGWPTTHILLGVHVPCGDGATQASTNAKDYRPLADLRLPPRTELLAGIVQAGPGITTDDQVEALHAVEQGASRNVVVSSPCGWSRRPQLVNTLFSRLRALSEVPL